ncbi:MAG TPA: hypothetical protein VIS49_08565 [Cyclobacteriaceae bacterium]
MVDLREKEVLASEVAFFYKDYPSYWFLLEVLDKDENGKAVLMRVIDYNKNKDVLRDYLLDELSGTNSQYIFVYAYPDGKCDL